MRICIPTEDDRGLESRAFDHFGSAPFFTMVDVESGQLEVVRNPGCQDHNRVHHDHQPRHHVDELTSHGIDALVCNGVGRQAFAALRKAGIDVLVPADGTVSDIIRALWTGETRTLSADEAAHRRQRGNYRAGADQRLHPGGGHRHAHAQRRGMSIRQLQTKGGD
jgi:predicted Fe-Mo cluster-binding NifX family protein